MLIEKLKEQIDDLEYKISNPEKQSWYFRKGIESQQRNLENFKREFEELREDFYEENSVNDLERELDDLIDASGKIKVTGMSSGYHKIAVNSKIKRVSEMIEMKNKYLDIELYELFER
tara:strand:+ start:151 stop:504 length:354 start_codon:yes stop_codon:yes gene_type:complete